jgi:hypothetical protein
MPHPDLPAEQAYVDRAYVRLDDPRAALLRTADAGATDVAAEAIESWASRRLVSFADAERGQCFGRIDSEGADDPLYIGRHWVHDDEDGTLVVNWQAPAARRRTFACATWCAGPSSSGRRAARRSWWSGSMGGSSASRRTRWPI